MNRYFKFKKFTIVQDRTLMKVNTDGVLLGAWCKCPDGNSVNFLDIGTGTGVIALMLAQRYAKAKVFALEIDEDSFKQAKENIANSPWNSRVFALNGDFNKYKEVFDRKFDCIVSNPPYFDNALLPEDNKATAKHTVSLTYDNLILGVKDLLREQGSFSVILPFEMHEKFVHLCNVNGLYCSRKTFVYSTNRKKVPKRVLMEFRQTIEQCAEDSLIILHNGNYTNEYKSLTGDFYLNF